MLAQLHVGGLIEHGPTAGAATERHWIGLFERYLPKRYRASSAFVIDSRGNRSRQIDIAIYDHFYSPLLFPQESAVHIPAESVYAVFEVKLPAEPCIVGYTKGNAKNAGSRNANRPTKQAKVQNDKVDNLETPYEYFV